MTKYLRFIDLKHKLDQEFMRLHSVGQLEMRLLEMISVSASLDQWRKVTDVMVSNHLGSPATIHRSLRLLRDSGLALVFHRGRDQRTKYLQASEIVYVYYSQLGTALTDLARDDAN